MNDIYSQMLGMHDLSTADDARNAAYEVMQQVVLSGLYRGGFFKEAAFYGGNCLRIFHGLGRYSEDMYRQSLLQGRHTIPSAVYGYVPVVMVKYAANYRR